MDGWVGKVLIGFFYVVNGFCVFGVLCCICYNVVCFVVFYWIVIGVFGCFDMVYLNFLLVFVVFVLFVEVRFGYVGFFWSCFLLWYYFWFGCWGEFVDYCLCI